MFYEYDNEVDKNYPFNRSDIEEHFILKVQVTEIAISGTANVKRWEYDDVDGLLIRNELTFVSN